MLGTLAVLVVATSLLLPGVSNAGSTLNDPGDCEPQTTEAESYDELGSEGCICDCLRESPPSCPEAGEKGLPETNPEGKAEPIEES